MGEKMDLFKKNKEEPKRKYVVGDKPKEEEIVADEQKQEENIITFDEPKESVVEDAIKEEIVADEPKEEENVVKQKSITVTRDVYDEIVILKEKNECETFSEAIDGLICLLREQKEKSNNYHKWVNQCFDDSKKIAVEIDTDSERIRLAIFKDMIKRYKEDFQ